MCECLSGNVIETSRAFLTLEKKRPNLRGKLELNLFLDRRLSESAL